MTPPSNQEPRWLDAIESASVDGDTRGLVALLRVERIPHEMQSRLAELLDATAGHIYLLEPTFKQRNYRRLETYIRTVTLGYQVLRRAGSEKLDAAVREFEISTRRSRSAIHHAVREARAFQAMIDYNLLSMPADKFELLKEAHKSGDRSAVWKIFNSVDFDPENPPPIFGPPLRDIRELRRIWVSHNVRWDPSNVSKDARDDRRGKVRGRRKSRTR